MRRAAARVAIVAGAGHAAAALLLDAATSALDPELVADELDVIRELAEGGMTMLIATHEMGPVREPVSDSSSEAVESADAASAAGAGG